MKAVFVVLLLLLLASLSACDPGNQPPQDTARWLLAQRHELDQYDCLDALWTRESSWNLHATNPTSGAYGIPQSLPANKMAEAGPDYLNSQWTQVKWGLDYLDAVYGGPCGGLAHSNATGWY